MDEYRGISERLAAMADEADATVATALNAAAAKIGSFSRAPGKRKDADRVAAVLTPEVVDALGEAFIGVREEEIQDPPHEFIGCEFQQADYAFAALLIASAEPGLDAPALAALERVEQMIGRMAPKQAEHVQFLAGLYPETPRSAALQAATSARLSDEPLTVAGAWAEELGLDLPAEFWSLSLTVPGTVEGGRADVLIAMNLDNTPGSDTRWSMRIGAINSNSLGGNRPPSRPDTDHGHYDRNDAIVGQLPPATNPIELPRVLADLERQHPNLSYDRAALSVSGTPGRLISPTKKKLLIAWLSGDIARGRAH